MRHLLKYALLLLLFAVCGCSDQVEHAGVERYEMVLPPPPPERSVETTERKLIKEGTIEFETDDLNSTRQTIIKAVEKYKGYISSDQEFNSPERESNTIIARVPADSFDSFLKDATKGVERFNSKEIKVIDVTTEFLDVQARLKTKKELENRFLDLLKQAKSVTEMLEIEKQLGELRSDIESMEGRLKYLQNQVSYSTLTITFYKSIPYQTEFNHNYKNGFRNGWNNLIWFFVALINVWPFILIGVALLVALRVYRRKRLKS
ncbi:DUF4349 domain-containing protein [Pontibacter anaerobius]|uniref:DUF4349 domain-containing protein n=1 Tax=Pontibacter anaerobius TaxID=2993940 RepID=A0ABT3RIE9_9BACT|nr:DUF4349 domain-containing protein [Pontibacter anaerobius]MCX2741010.1 DUF4349 domain-containing protein [Pontibacter anaerobius]